MKTGNLNGVDLLSTGGGTNFLADDGTYKAAGGGGSQDLESVLTQGNTSTLGANFGNTVSIERQNDTASRYHQIFQRGDNSGGASVIYTEGDGSNGVSKFGIADLSGVKFIEIDLSVPSIEFYQPSTFDDDIEVNANSEINGNSNVNGTEVITRENDTNKRFHQIFQRGTGANGSIVSYTEGDGSNGVSKFGIATNSLIDILSLDSSDLSASFGGDIKGDNFLAIGDVERDNALAKWSLQSRLFPFISERFAAFGDNVGNGGSLTTNAYFDGTVYKSLTAGECSLFTLTSGAGDYVIQGYTAAASDETITWVERYRIDKDGNSITKGTNTTEENILGDKFLGIGDTTRDDHLAGWGAQSRFFPIVSENFAIVGDNGSLGGFVVANAYYDGTNWRSIEAGESQQVLFSGGSGLYRISGATSTSDDEIITWATRFEIDKDGNTTVKGDLTAEGSIETQDTLHVYNTSTSQTDGFYNVFSDTANDTDDVPYTTLKQFDTYSQLTAGWSGAPGGANELRIRAADSSGTETQVATFTDEGLIVQGSKVNLANLPISDTSLAVGDLWNDSGTLKIKL